MPTRIIPQLALLASFIKLARSYDDEARLPSSHAGNSGHPAIGIAARSTQGILLYHYTYHYTHESRDTN